MTIIKITVFTLLLLAAQTTAPAQETEFGKRLAADFWKALEEKRVVAAEGKLTSLKRREPNFDASKMERALNDAKGQRTESRESAKATLRAGISASNNLDELFRSRNIQADSSDTAESIGEEIAKYAKMADDVSSTDRSSIANSLQSILAYLGTEIPAQPEKNKKLSKCVIEANDAGSAEICYLELLLHRSYWETAKKIFPQDRQIVAAFSEVDKTVTDLGSPDQRAATAAKNNNARIDAARMPKAVVKDAPLERIFENTFNRTNQARNWGYTFLRAVILSEDYGIVRNSITGIVVGRNRFGAIAYKGKDGKCYNANFRIDQNYVGSSFTGNWRGDFSGFVAEMRCENVNK